MKKPSPKGKLQKRPAKKRGRKMELQTENSGNPWHPEAQGEARESFTAECNIGHLALKVMPLPHRLTDGQRHGGGPHHTLLQKWSLILHWYCKIMWLPPRITSVPSYMLKNYISLFQLGFAAQRQDSVRLNLTVSWKLRILRRTLKKRNQ